MTGAGRARRIDEPAGSSSRSQPYQATVLVLTDGRHWPAGADGRRAMPAASGGTSPLDRAAGRWPSATRPPQPVDLPHVWEDQPGRGTTPARRPTPPPSISTRARRVVDRPRRRRGTGTATRPSGSAGRPLLPGRDPTARSARSPRSGSTGRLRPGLGAAVPAGGHRGAAPRRQRDRDHRRQHRGQRAGGRRRRSVRLAAESEARYGRRFRMQDLDQAMATVRSGLLAVPALVERRGEPQSASARNAQASSCMAASKTWPPGERPVVPAVPACRRRSRRVGRRHPGRREELVLAPVLDQEPGPARRGQVRPVGQRPQAGHVQQPGVGVQLGRHQGGEGGHHAADHRRPTTRGSRAASSRLRPPPPENPKVPSRPGVDAVRRRRAPAARPGRRSPPRRRRSGPERRRPWPGSPRAAPEMTSKRSSSVGLDALLPPQGLLRRAPAPPAAASAGTGRTAGCPRRRCRAPARRDRAGPGRSPAPARSTSPSRSRAARGLEPGAEVDQLLGADRADAAVAVQPEHARAAAGVRRPGAAARPWCRGRSRPTSAVAGPARRPGARCPPRPRPAGPRRLPQAQHPAQRRARPRRRRRTAGRTAPRPASPRSRRSGWSVHGLAQPHRPHAAATLDPGPEEDRVPRRAVVQQVPHPLPGVPAQLGDRHRRGGQRR